MSHKKKKIRKCELGAFNAWQLATWASLHMAVLNRVKEEKLANWTQTAVMFGQWKKHFLQLRLLLLLS